jgi:hypothetical protein
MSVNIVPYPSIKRARLIAKIGALPLFQRKQVWSLYRFFIKGVKNSMLISDYTSLCNTLYLGLRNGPCYQCYALALHLARFTSKMVLQKRGVSARVARPLILEAFHLIRIQIQVWFNIRMPVEFAHYTFGAPAGNRPVMVAYCDGSFNNSKAGIGVLLLAGGELTTLAEISTPVAVSSAFLAELAAAVTALQTIRALGGLQAILHVDAQGVLAAISATATIRHKSERDKLLGLISSFSYLKVVLVPRLFNFKADRLAAASASCQGIAPLLF